MRRGGYGKPWRPPADGWSTPPLTYLGGLYQHQNGRLNGIPAYQNNTQVPLGTGATGSPVTRFAKTPAQASGCESYPFNGLPLTPWIGSGADQLLPGAAVNTFTPIGTNDFGRNCRLRGGKWVQALRQWHGAYGWLSHDAGGCADQYCSASDSWFEGYQSTPDQTKYLTVTFSEAYTYNFYADDIPTGTYYENSTAASGAISVAAASGQITNSLATNYTQYTTPAGGSRTQTANLVNGVGYDVRGNHPHGGGGSPIDGSTATDFHCQGWPALPSLDGAGVSLGGLISDWNAFLSEEDPDYPANNLPLLGSVTAYAGTSAFTFPDGSQRYAYELTASKTATTVTWDYEITLQFNNSGAWVTVSTQSFSGTRVLSAPNTSAEVYADVQSLLGNWNLADDAQYPPRTDGLWQIAPLMSRDEAAQNITPVQGFIPYYMADYRAPVTDASGNAPFTTPANPPPAGWTYAPNNNDTSGNPPGSPAYGGPAAWNATYAVTPWLDPNAWGFTFPAGFDQGNSAATALVQYALTGAVLGAPNASGCQNYFDFRAEVWRCCQYDNGEGEYIDWYLQGHGQWLYDAIDETGAQLPHCATQWTNNYAAVNKLPYAWLNQSDTQTYDQAGQPGPESDLYAYRADALWAQKCAEYLELWPSYNFFRPAGMDRFSFDQSNLFCVASQSGSVVTLTDNAGNPVTMTDTTGVWGGSDVGGFYTLSAASGSTVTLNALQLALPAGSIQGGFGKLRFPTAPAILGRDAVTSVTDNGDGTCTLLLTAAESWLLTGDMIDLYSTTITYDANGNRVSEAMTTLASNLTATVIDTTHVKVTATHSAIAGTVYIMSHGAPDWCWDDNGRKGDLAGFTWLKDFRTNGEVGRLAGVTDCSGNTPPAGSPTANNGYASFSQTAYAVPFKPCCPMAVFITPNGESSTNSVTIGFPSSFNFDGRYGAMWQAEIEQAMADLLYQAPHTPCGNTLGWTQDNGTCQADNGTTLFYAFAPVVETRIAVPTNGGNSGKETAPTPPTGIGYTSPVTSGSGLQAPGVLGYDPTTGNPSGSFTWWGYRLAIENSSCAPASCRFPYVDLENLPCVNSYAP